MKLYRQLLRTLLKITIVLLVCAACQASNSQNYTQINSQDLTGEILVWDEYSVMLTPSEKEVYEQRVKTALADFQKVYPNVKIVFEFFNQEEAIENFIQQSQRGGGANLLVARSNHNVIKLIQLGLLQSLDDYNIDESIFYPKSLLQARYRNKLYGIPIYLITQALCYNTQKVKEPAQTLSDLVKQAQKGYSVGLNSGFRETFWGAGTFVKSEIKLSYPSEKSLQKLAYKQQQLLQILEQQGWQKWMEWLKQIQSEPNFAITNDESALQKAFIQGQLAYLTCSSHWIPYAKEILGADKLRVSLLPHENYSATPLLQTGMLIFNRASSPQQLKIALTFAQFLTNSQQQLKLSSQEIFLPSNRTIMPNPVLYPIQAVLMKQVQSSLAFSLDEIEQLNAIADTGENLYRQVLAGEIEVETAANQLKELLHQLPLSP